MTKMIGIVTSIALAVSMLACTDPVADDKQSELLPEPQPSNAEVVPGDTAQATAATIGTEATPAAGNGCSIVEWCNQPGSNGTVFRQVGCTLPSAQQECTREAIQICGTIVQPFIIITP
jgi:hypothetical protein